MSKVQKNEHWGVRPIVFLAVAIVTATLLVQSAFGASAVISDPLLHANGTPIAGTYTEAQNPETVFVDPRPATLAEWSNAADWDVRLVFWYELTGWKLFTTTGFLLRFQ